MQLLRYYGRAAQSLLLRVSLAAAISGCTDRLPDEAPAGRAQQTILYGDDNRREPYDFGDQNARGLLEQASVAIVPASHLIDEDSDAISLVAPTLGELVGLCADERFFDQPCAAECSGTLIGADLVLTAGHCIDVTPCSEMRLVFDYRVDATNRVLPLTAASIFRCSEVLVHRFDAQLDYAIIRLDSPATGRAPARVRIGDLPLEPSSELLFAGYPSGLPMKIARDAWVSRNRAEIRDYFAASLDAFPGSSGSGVFLAKSLELVGVLARGPLSAYAHSATESCVRPVQVPESTPGGVEATYVWRATAEFCSMSEDATLCACGDGTCSDEGGESTQNCPQDCGAHCGDSVCNGDESGNVCYADCGACGNAVCEPHEAARLSCCEDCGCPNGLACGAGRCQLQLGNVNGDDQVDLLDAASIDDALSGKHADYFAASVADVDCNGELDDLDSAYLRSSVATGERLPCQRVDSMAAGANHTCAMTSDGKVRCWGSGANGQLGNASTNSVGDDEVPAALGPLALGGAAIQITAGRQHSCALLADGTLRCWGAGDQGQLGYGNTLAVGDDESPADAGPVPLGAEATQVVAGGFHTCAILKTGEVKCWGDNLFGQLGYGHARRIGDDERIDALPALRFESQVIELAAGLNHTCARLADQTVRCWGANMSGQLGYGHTQNIGDDEPAANSPPVSIGDTVTHLAAGWMNTCAVVSAGRLKCWGDGGMMQLGNGGFANVGDNETPADVGSITFDAPIVSLTIGEFRVCAGSQAGKLRCWGLNSFGQLGMGHVAPMLPGTRAESLPPLPLAGEVRQVVAGANHSCAEIAGEVKCWGKNDFGQLGYGHTLTLGDDETLSSLKSVGLFPLVSEEWRFKNPYGLAVYWADRGSNDHATRLALQIENNGTTTLADLQALYLFDTSESPSSTVVAAAPRPHSPAAFVDIEHNPSLHTLVLDFAGMPALLPGRRLRHPAEVLVNLRFGDWSATWDESNDYSAIGRSSCGRYRITDRIQIVDQGGKVIYGWSPK